MRLIGSRVGSRLALQGGHTLSVGWLGERARRTQVHMVRVGAGGESVLLLPAGLSHIRGVRDRVCAGEGMGGVRVCPVSGVRRRQSCALHRPVVS